MKSLNNKRIRNNLMKLLVMAVFVSISCSRIYDNVEKYATDEIVYIDKLDGILRVKVGYERVEIDLLEAGRIPASQIYMAKASKTVVECEDFTEPGHRRVIDSICSWVNITGLTQLKNYELTIYTEDVFGNRSLPLKTNVKPYTEENLNTIEFSPPSISASRNAAQIEWIEGISAPTHQVVSYSWHYTDRDGTVITFEDEGDNVYILLENVASETDIPVTLNCKMVPTIFQSTGIITPIIDTVDFHKTFTYRLSSDATDVIFLKTPIPNFEDDFKNPVTFSWTKVDNVDGYTLKVSLAPNFPESGTYSMDAGDVSEYAIDNDDMLLFFNSLSPNDFVKSFYWTVTPTVQSAPVKTSYRMLTVWSIGYFYRYDRSDWEFLQASSTIDGAHGNNMYDDNLGTTWHSVDPVLPHWVITDLKTPLSIFMAEVYRQNDPYGLGDTQTVELYLGDSPDPYGTWTKIGSGKFISPDSRDQVVLWFLTTDNVTKGRYLKVMLPEGRAGGNPYANIAELYLYYQ